VRGILTEARLSTEYAAKGFEWLAETTSPFFRKFDFYNKADQLTVSLKSVNAEKTLTLKIFWIILTNLLSLKNQERMLSGEENLQLKTLD
jgi:hypothetical protein